MQTYFIKNVLLCFPVELYVIARHYEGLFAEQSEFESATEKRSRRSPDRFIQKDQRCKVRYFFVLLCFDVYIVTLLNYGFVLVFPPFSLQL